MHPKMFRRFHDNSFKKMEEMQLSTLSGFTSPFDALYEGYKSLLAESAIPSKCYLAMFEEVKMVDKQVDITVCSSRYWDTWSGKEDTRTPYLTFMARVEEGVSGTITGSNDSRQAARDCLEYIQREEIANNELNADQLFFVFGMLMALGRNSFYLGHSVSDDLVFKASFRYQPLDAQKEALATMIEVTFDYKVVVEYWTAAMAYINSLDDEDEDEVTQVKS